VVNGAHPLSNDGLEFVDEKVGVVLGCLAPAVHVGTLLSWQGDEELLIECPEEPLYNSLIGGG
jgi:hypothetical protein